MIPFPLTERSLARRNLMPPVRDANDAVRYRTKKTFSGNSIKSDEYDGGELGPCRGDGDRLLFQ